MNELSARKYVLPIVRTSLLLQVQQVEIIHIDIEFASLTAFADHAAIH